MCGCFSKEEGSAAETESLLRSRSIDKLIRADERTMSREVKVRFLPLSRRETMLTRQAG